MAAGAATLAYVRENGLAARADTLGARMLGRLREFAADHPFVGDVRGRGLMIGVELVDPAADTPAGTPPPPLPGSPPPCSARAWTGASSSSWADAAVPSSACCRR